MSAETTDADSLAETGDALDPLAGGDGAADADADAEAQLPRPRRPRPTGARCDACHERGSRVVRSRDGLMTVCARCARGADVSNNDSAEAIAAIVNRAPLVERRTLMRRLLARRALHSARRDRKIRPGL